MIKFIICEDNVSTLETLGQTVTKSMMKYNMEYKVYKFTGYNKQLKELINEEENIKVYILDIEMSVVSGLEIASEVREMDDDSNIIFVTSHPECKDDIFYSRLKATDYISKKNRCQERLSKTIEHVMTKLYRKKYLSFSYNHVYNRLLLGEINYIEKFPTQNKCIIHLTNGSQKYIKETLTKLDEELQPLFLRTHKSCLINLSNIKYIEYNNHTVYFKSGDNTDLLTPNSKKELKSYVRVL